MIVTLISKYPDFFWSLVCLLPLLQVSRFHWIGFNTQSTSVPVLIFPLSSGGQWEKVDVVLTRGWYGSYRGLVSSPLYTCYPENILQTLKWSRLFLRVPQKKSSFKKNFQYLSSENKVVRIRIPQR